ncbi:MAG TPA: transglycosylase domain-containing protein [Candidatus Limnocylindrales bacterium]|nr:transglycosylase domain-containing protein [Candidatus Limnocylindrales bacterium]
MQTSLARRQRHRRAARRRPSGSSVIKRTAIAIPILLFVAFLGTGAAGLLGVVAAYGYYSEGLPDPKAQLAELDFDQQTRVYDKTGDIELARLGERKRELVAFAELPDEVLDATTAIEDKDFWDNPGFDLAGFVSATIDTVNGRPRGGSTITQQLVRARLLPAFAFEGSREERKIREIIQSIRLTQAYPGVKGKQEIITAYLNQNFYGNHSYGIKAAAGTYFNKELADLTLAEAAILAAIPQSPTKFDLVKNAEQVCETEPPEGTECPKYQLVVPADSEIVIRRNHILDRMKTQSPLSGDRHSIDEYEEAKSDPVVLAPQLPVAWKAPHFVWQVREELGRILCPELPLDECEKIDTGGYHVRTTLDWTMQTTTQKWVYVAARTTNFKDTRTYLKNLKIPSGDHGWLLNLKGKNLHNGAAAVIDYRTGKILAYVGSGSYTSPGNARFQPQFDVLSDGWRQPGSSIKPINYAIGIDDRTMTASTRFMDVVTDFGRDYTPTQADNLERGPVRLRSALQFSLNIPSIKAGLMNGLDRFYERSRDFGIQYVPGSVPVTSMGIGTLELHPIDLLGAYGAIANGGVLMPRTTIEEVVDHEGVKIWPDPGAGPVAGEPVISPQAAYIVTDILAGNTNTKVNPFWGEWAVYEGRSRRPAAYKTGTTNDNRDVHAYGYLAPPEDPTVPALAVGVWMGNSNNEPNTDTLSLASSAPLWSRIMRDVSAGLPIADWSRPGGLQEVTVDAISGMRPGPFTTKTVQELFIEGTAPTEPDDLRRTVEIDTATGDLWQDGCLGPRKSVGALDFSRVEENFPNWGQYTRGWVKRAARGTGVSGGPEGTRTTYFYGSGFYPFGRTWGGIFAPTEKCTPPPPKPTQCIELEEGPPCPSDRPPGNGNGNGNRPTPTPRP